MIAKLHGKGVQRAWQIHKAIDDMVKYYQGNKAKLIE